MPETTPFATQGLEILPRGWRSLSQTDLAKVPILNNVTIRAKPIIVNLGAETACACTLHDGPIPPITQEDMLLYYSWALILS